MNYYNNKKRVLISYICAKIYITLCVSYKYILYNMYTHII